MGKLFIVAGLVLVAVGLFIHYGDRIPFLGKLPGDWVIEGKNFRIYFPLATSILLSLLLSLVFWLISRSKS